MITLFKDSFFDVLDKVSEPYYLNDYYTPDVKIKEGDEGYDVMISVPGLTKDDIKISAKENLLVISYEKDHEKDENYFVDSFKKSYKIPKDVNQDNIEGKVENGILKLFLPFDEKKPIERLILLN